MKHLDHLELRLSNERMRLSRATSAGEREIRSVWVLQLEKEVQGEREFLKTQDGIELTDDEILRELMS